MIKIDNLKLHVNQESKRIERQRKTRYLPGETRATCGSSGFQDLKPRARAERYRREVYTDTETRDLTPQQNLESSLEITSTRRSKNPLTNHEHVLRARTEQDFHSYPDLIAELKQSGSSLRRANHTVTQYERQCSAKDYVNRLHENLWAAEYQTSDFAGQYPLEIQV